MNRCHGRTTKTINGRSTNSNWQISMLDNQTSNIKTLLSLRESTTKKNNTWSIDIQSQTMKHNITKWRGLLGNDCSMFCNAFLSHFNMWCISVISSLWSQRARGPWCIYNDSLWQLVLFSDCTSLTCSYAPGKTRSYDLSTNQTLILFSYSQDTITRMDPRTHFSK